jgi:DNA-damage-inducible protein J
MPKTNSTPQADFIRVRIDTRTKVDAEAILEKLGLNASEAIRLFYRQVILGKGLPFEVKIPNAATRRALKDTDAGKGLVRHEGVDEVVGSAKKGAGGSDR